MPGPEVNAPNHGTVPVTKKSTKTKNQKPVKGTGDRKKGFDSSKWGS